ncbi:MAG: N-acetylgalactosamine-4-sulfatase [Kiritimatiellaceae bacterium]|nr:N-acetylgalactosamine-4-sulfatase [Kiritimatiellaceae bacterium]
MKSIAMWLTVGCLMQSFSGAAQSPNIIIVMTDDQGYPNLSCVGHPLLETPSVDKLYDNGVRLTDFHVDPSCAPTRSALMTGRYSGRNGVWHTVMGRNLLRQREVTMADMFAASGYATGLFGKWHLGDVYPYRPEDRGFQQTVVHGAGGVGQTPDYWGNDYFDDAYRVNGTMRSFEGFCTDVFFTEAMQFMEQSVRQQRPFFAFITPNAPHWPYYAPEESIARVVKRAEERGIALTEEMAAYYGMIENIDDNFGRLQAFLQREGVEENTILVFCSDNGPVIRESIQLFNAELRGGKVSHYDGGHRVPWFMRWPAGGLDHAVDVDRVTAHVDILPTLLELCGLQAPPVELDGMSLVPLLRDAHALWPDRQLMVENQRLVDPLKYRNFAVMSDCWRLVGTKGGTDLQLYDMRTDRSQRSDRAKTHPDVLAQLLSAYDAFWADVSQEHGLISRMKVGSVHQNPVCLTAHDWLGSSLWNQTHVADPATGRFGPPRGFWAVDVDADGWYQISLRRWPAEADRAINDPYVGVSYDVDTVTLTVQGQTLKQAVPVGAKEVTFRVKLKSGEAKLDTLFTGAGESISAFYAYILRETGTVSAAWKTREGLGLPLAQWPEEHGVEPEKMYASEVEPRGENDE